MSLMIWFGRLAIARPTKNKYPLAFNCRGGILARVTLVFFRSGFHSALVLIGLFVLAGGAKLWVLETALLVLGLLAANSERKRFSTT